ncbi:MAG: VOC family protein [Pseudomonadota bacterium]
MTWFIHHVNIPAHDTRDSSNFYERVLGVEEVPWVFPDRLDVVIQDPEKLRLLPCPTRALVANPGIHVVKPDPGFSISRRFHHNPTIGGHVAYHVADLDQVIARLEARGVPHTLTGEYAIPNIRQVYFFDPAMNLVEANACLTADRAELSAAPWSIHHVNIAAIDVRETAEFYMDVLAMEEAAWTFPANRGAVSADPAELTLMPSDTMSQGANTGLHIIKPDPLFAQKNGLIHNPSIGGHIAYQVPDLARVIATLEELDVPFSLTGEFAIPGMRHLYCFDPAMNLIEVNEML